MIQCVGYFLYHLLEVSVQVKTLDSRQLESRLQYEASCDNTPVLSTLCGSALRVLNRNRTKESPVYVCLALKTQETIGCAVKTTYGKIQWLAIFPKELFVCSRVKQGQGNVNGSTSLSWWPTHVWRNIFAWIVHSGGYKQKEPYIYVCGRIGVVV